MGTALKGFDGGRINAVILPGGLYNIFQHSRSACSYIKGWDFSASSEDLGFYRVNMLRGIHPDIPLHFKVPGFPTQGHN